MAREPGKNMYIPGGKSVEIDSGEISKGSGENRGKRETFFSLTIQFLQYNIKNFRVKVSFFISKRYYS